MPGVVARIYLGVLFFLLNVAVWLAARRSYWIFKSYHRASCRAIHRTKRRWWPPACFWKKRNRRRHADIERQLHRIKPLAGQSIEADTNFPAMSQRSNHWLINILAAVSAVRPR